MHLREFECGGHMSRDNIKSGDVLIRLLVLAISRTLVECLNIRGYDTGDDIPSVSRGKDAMLALSCRNL